MFRVLLILWVVIGVIPFTASADHSPKIQIVGSTTALPNASRATERFEKFKKIEKFKSSHRLRILVNAGGSGVGIHSVARGRSDIGMASREISPSERKRFEGSRLKVHTVGVDAVACVISSEVYDAGIRDLTRQKILDIYLGKIRNWSEVGGPDRKIVVVDKERHRGTRHVFMSFIFGNPTAKTPGTILVTGSNNEEQTKIAQSDSAITYGSMKVIDDFSCEVKENSVTAIIGPSGCGKSTLLRSLYRMNDRIAEFHLAGQVLIKGENIYHPDVDVYDLTRRVGMIFQKPCVFPKSIFENVLFGVKHRIDKKDY
jgi:ABC-type phosphate transport system substrate-binding protein